MTDQLADVSIACVLDMSGSMSSIAQATRNGFNEYKNEQARAAGNSWITLTCFDTEVERPYLAWNARDVPDVGPEVYTPRGMTALNDALADSLEALDGWARNNSWFSGKFVVMLMTDGFENSSKKYPHPGNPQLRDLVRARQDAGWEFVLFAANRDPDVLASELGVSPTRAHSYTPDAKDASDVYVAMASSTQALRGGDREAYAGTMRATRSAQKEK